ncbi:MAG TPA: hypothetical protein VLJ86_04975 [Ramlibacter sp.]|nr:hypothetical protein [Ramlibacter sp.]
MNRSRAFPLPLHLAYLAAAVAIVALQGLAEFAALQRCRLRDWLRPR